MSPSPPNANKLPVFRHGHCRLDAVLTLALLGLLGSPLRAEEEQKAQLGLLLVSTDTECTLALDGNPYGDLEAGGIRKLALLPGEHLLQARTADGSEHREVVAVEAGTQRVVVLQLQETPTLHADEARARLREMGLVFSSAQAVQRVRAGDSEAVRLFMQAGMSPNLAVALSDYPEGLTLLGLAAREGHAEIVQTLIEVGAEVNAAEAAPAPLREAAARGHTAIVRTLVEAGADLNYLESGGSALQAAAENGHTETAQLLLEAGASPDAGEPGSTTPLIAAIRGGHHQLATALVEVGADLDTTAHEARFSREVSALQIAVEAEDVESVRLLTEGGATPGLLPFEAARRGSTEIVQAFLDAGFAVDRRGRDAWTLLHYAAERGHTDTVKLLLEGGADSELQNSWGWTPLKLAKKNGHRRVVELLKQ